MKLSISKRLGEKKSELTKIRREKDIPAVIYQDNGKGELITVDGKEFAAVIRKLEKGFLPTTVFELSEGKTSRKALVKDIQYHRTTYQVEHIDFMPLDDKKPVSVKVPVVYKGVADCEGIKLGGFLREVIRHIKVSCLPGNMPTSFGINVSKLKLGQSIRVRDIAMDSNVKSLVNEKEVVGVIARR